LIFKESVHVFGDTPSVCIEVSCEGEHNELRHKPFCLYVNHRNYELESKQKHLSRLVPHFEDALRQGSRIFDETARKYGSKTVWPRKD